MAGDDTRSLQGVNSAADIAFAGPPGFEPWQGAQRFNAEAFVDHEDAESEDTAAEEHKAEELLKQWLQLIASPVERMEIVNCSIVDTPRGEGR